MEGIVEKIRKLLALHERPGTEAEGQVALEQARRLMAKHRLEEGEVRGTKEEEIICLPAESYEGNLASWIASLSNVIAKNFRCYAVNVPKRARRVDGRGANGTAFRQVGGEVQYFGYAEDAKIAATALQSAKRMALHLAAEYGKTVPDFRASRTSYLRGFVRGLSAQFEQAEVQDSSMALILRTPPAVKAHVNQVFKEGLRKQSTSYDVRDSRAYYRGVKDGKAYDVKGRYLS